MTREKPLKPLAIKTTPKIEEILLGLLRNLWMLRQAELKYEAAGVTLSIFTDVPKSVPSLEYLMYGLLGVEEQIETMGSYRESLGDTREEFAEEFLECADNSKIPEMEDLRVCIKKALKNANWFVNGGEDV